MHRGREAWHTGFVVKKLKAGSVWSLCSTTSRKHDTQCWPEKQVYPYYRGRNSPNAPDLTIVRQHVGRQTIRKMLCWQSGFLLTADPEYFRPEPWWGPTNNSNYKTSSLHQHWDQAVIDGRIVKAELHLDRSTPHGIPPTWFPWMTREVRLWEGLTWW